MMNRSIEFYGLYRSTNTDFTSFFGFTANQSSRAQIRKKWHHRLSLSRSSIIETWALCRSIEKTLLLHTHHFSPRFSNYAGLRGGEIHTVLCLLFIFSTQTRFLCSPRGRLWNALCLQIYLKGGVRVILDLYRIKIYSFVRISRRILLSFFLGAIDDRESMMRWFIGQQNARLSVN